jgi:undecaprenyl-diphosphatase
MDDRLLSLILPHLEHWGYFVILFAAFLETSAFLGLLVPGETIVVIAGLLAGTGNLDLIKVMASASVGAILGDTVGYFIGCRFGESFFRRYGRYILFKPR